MNLDNAKAREYFDLVCAERTLRGACWSEFVHPISGATVGSELHTWSPGYFIEWYEAQVQLGFPADNTTEVLAHLVSMAKAVA